MADNDAWLVEPKRSTDPHTDMSSMYIRDYSYRPDPLVFVDHDGKNDPRRLYVGVEFEVETTGSTGGECSGECGCWVEADEMPSDVWYSLFHNSSEWVAGDLVGENWLPYYATEDGSLEHGFELTTHPMTVPAAVGLDVWGGLVDQVESGNLHRDPSNAGMHIHLSKAAFTRRSFSRFLALCKRQEELLFRVGRRSPNMYCQKSYSATEARLSDSKATHSLGGKYGFVNASPTSTIELRYPAALVDTTHIMANIELADVLHTIATHGNVRDLTLPNVIEQVVVAGAWRWDHLYLALSDVGMLDGVELSISEGLKEVAKCV